MVSPEKFVRIWQTAANIKEICAKTGLKTNSVCSRAKVYRKKGISLKHFHRGRVPMSPSQIKKLKALAESLNGKESGHENA